MERYNPLSMFVCGAMCFRAPRRVPSFELSDQFAGTRQAFLKVKE